MATLSPYLEVAYMSLRTGSPVFIKVESHKGNKLKVHVYTIQLIQYINNAMMVWLCVCRGMEIVSQLPDIMAYFQHSCLAPIYFVYSSVSIYQTFTRFIGQFPA